MTNHARILKRALAEALQEKLAFQPPPDPQAPGPGGQPVDPGMGGAPMDPMMGGAPPMDPMMGGAPPMDPGMGGDPMMGAPMDLPPEELLGGEDDPADGDASISSADVEALKSVQENTMDIVRQTLEMVGKAKPAEPKPEEAAEAEAGAPPPLPPAPEAQPGPVTGQPGFDPEAFGKLGAAVRAKLAQDAEGGEPGFLRNTWGRARDMGSRAWDSTQQYMGENPWAGPLGGGALGGLTGLMLSRGLRRGRNRDGSRRRLDLGDILAAGALGVGGAMLGRHLTPQPPEGAA